LSPADSSHVCHCLSSIATAVGVPSFAKPHNKQSMRFELVGSWNSSMTPWLVNPAREKMRARARKEFCQDWNSPGDGFLAYSWKLARSFSAIWLEPSPDSLACGTCPSRAHPQTGERGHASCQSHFAFRKSLGSGGSPRRLGQVAGPDCSTGRALSAPTNESPGSSLSQ
jgi:hypothetical protein